MAFRILGLPAGKFTHLFALSDRDLAAQGGVRRTVDGNFHVRLKILRRWPIASVSVR
jgi:hypothetical protein